MARHTIRVVSWSAALLLAVFSLVSSSTAIAQSLVRPRVTQAVRESSLVSLKGNTLPLAISRYDRGRVQDDFQVSRALLLLKRSDEQQAALESYLAESHTPGSAHYHQWLTPTQFGALYGPADSDIQAVVAWLQSHGLQVSHVTKGKTAIEFSGTEVQFESAFHTAIHSYAINGESHHANVSDPQVPEALAPVIAGLSPLNDFRPVPHLHVLGQATYSPETHRATPQWTYPSSTTTESFVLAPADFAVQYDLNPLYAAGVDGSGQTIGIISASNIDISVASAYRALFGLSANPPQVIIDGSDPGVTDAVEEAYLDVEVAGSVAPKATINLYTAASNGVQSGLYLAAIRAVEDNAASVLSLSYGQCELMLGPLGNHFWGSLWQQAAAQGQTVFVSAGDGGVAGCDNFNAIGTPASRGPAVSGFASTPWNIAVGGTDFYYSYYNQPGSTALSNQLASYWKTATTTTPSTSLQQVIPEQPWNDSNYGLNTTALYSGALNIIAGSGGASSYVFADLNSTTKSSTTYLGYPKPSWQTASGVPQDGVRDLPDVSLFAANGANYSFYPICASTIDCVSHSGATGAVTITSVGGTSASAPAMAAIMALIDQKYGAQGQANYVFYPMATQFPAAFHDVTVGSNNVPCLLNSSECKYDGNGNLSYGEYGATTGYDLATGLGSVDANLLVTNWNKITFKSTATTLTVSPSTLTHGNTATLTALVSASGGGTPTGNVIFSPSGYVAGSSMTLIFLDSTGQPIAVSGASNQATLDSSGKAQLSTNLLPGGTYQVQAQYAGDGTYASSKSTTASITVSPENSKVNLSSNIFSSAGTTATVPYGTDLNFTAQPVSASVSLPANSSGFTLGINGRATGTVTFSESASGQTATASIGADGRASWNPGGLAIGSHSVTANYSGDASFNASSAVFPFTVTKGTPRFMAWISSPVVPTTGSVTITLIARYAQGITAPTGNVTVTLKPLDSSASSPALTSALTSGTSITGDVMSYASTIFHSLPAGLYQLSTQYAGDSNWNATTTNYQTGDFAGIQVQASSLQPTNTSLSLNPTSLTGDGTVTLTATVTGGSGSSSAPTGKVTFAFDAGSVTLATTSLAPAGVGTSTATYILSTKTIPAYLTSSGLFSVVAGYSGDSTYAASRSNESTLQLVGNGDFSVMPQLPGLTLKSGSKGTLTLNLLPLKGFAGTVNLNCTPSSSSIACKLSPSAANISSASTITVTIDTQTQVATTSNNSHKSWPFGVGASLAALLLLGVPVRRRSWRSMLGVLLLLVTIGGMSACGGSSSKGSTGGGGTTTTTQNAPAGTYSVLITGQANGITHNVKVDVVVE